MNYEFPQISRIEPILDAIKDKPEFIHVQKEFFSIVNYVVNTPDTFPRITENMSPEELNKAVLLRECRGIAFDEDGYILSRPYSKFFNLNERPETQSNVIDFNETHHVLEKLDGSFIRPLYNKKDKDFRVATKMGLTDTAANAEKHIADKMNYYDFFKFCYDMNMTPIFEWCSEQNRIVILYEEPKLVLTAIRDLYSGRYMAYDQMVSIANNFKLPVVGTYPSINNINEFMSTVDDNENIEGFVIRFVSGHQLKVKTSDYVLKHKSADIVSNNRQLIELILNGNIDDIKTHVLENEIKKIENMEKLVSETVLDLSDQLKKFYSKYKHLSRKEFALTVMKNEKPFFSKNFFAMMDSKDPVELTKNFLKSNVTTNIKLKRLSEEYGVFNEVADSL